MPVTISAAVEGPTDEAVAKKLIQHVGAVPDRIYGKKGKPHLKDHIGGYNNAAHYQPWLILVDLDRDAECPPPFCHLWVPRPAPLLCFRVAVRAVEAWLLADPERLAAFLGVARTRIPSDPERLQDPKAEMVTLARHSRLRDIREDMVPRAGSGRSVGPLYTSRLIHFASDFWRPGVASSSAPSLARAINCLRRLAAS